MCPGENRGEKIEDERLEHQQRNKGRLRVGITRIDHNYNRDVSKKETVEFTR